MRTIDIITLNKFLADSKIQYAADTPIPIAGQREVYIGKDLTTNEQCVVKVSHHAPYNIGRIQREISILTKINSPLFPNIIFDAFISQENLGQYFDQLDQDANSKEIEDYKNIPIQPFYLTVEGYIDHLDWGTLTRNLDSHILCDFLKHCFTALNLLWENKIVHRDIKPGNILVKKDYTPVIIDLGIAKSFNEGTSDLTLTFFKNPHTIRFASPEQLQDRKKDISYKTDQYSAGLVAYYLLTGSYPFGILENIGPEEVLKNMLQNNYIPVEKHGIQCSPEIESFIKKLLSPQPYQRFRNSNGIFNALESIKGVLP